MNVKCLKKWNRKRISNITC